MTRVAKKSRVGPESQFPTRRCDSTRSAGHRDRYCWSRKNTAEPDVATVIWNLPPTTESFPFTGVQTALEPSVGEDSKVTSAEFVGQANARLPPVDVPVNDTVVEVPTSWFGPRA